ncbi:hypothetical protein F4778DRAFT_792327 [Xylariomycetidae sp. FL2044]|nr:hypothetical protein F4778DRAFT_792327 [Xylariomycetidae sp. FL2044]
MMAKRANLVLGQLEDDQLRSFSWDMDVCIPLGVMGQNGIISHRQRLLHSISLMTYYRCDKPYAREKGQEVDLSSLRHLKHLKWIGLRPQDIATLSLAVRNNQNSLQRLELDFVSWSYLAGRIGDHRHAGQEGEDEAHYDEENLPEEASADLWLLEDFVDQVSRGDNENEEENDKLWLLQRLAAYEGQISDDEGYEDEETEDKGKIEDEEHIPNDDDLESNAKVDKDATQPQAWFANSVLQINNSRLRPVFFPNIRLLSLSETPLTPGIAHVLNFETLISLTLRSCPGWRSFLESVIQLGVPIKLRAFALQTLPAADSSDAATTSTTLCRFLDVFETLEELYLSHIGPIDALKVWSHAANHTGLRRLVLQQRGLVPVLHRVLETDVLDQALPSGNSLLLIAEDPTLNPLYKLHHLEAVDLGCEPDYLPFFLLPFQCKASLKLIYVRPRGIASVDYVAYGEFRLNSCYENAIFRRGSSTTDECYTEIEEGAEAWREVVDRYQNVLQASVIPIIPELGWWWL